MSPDLADPRHSRHSHTNTAVLQPALDGWLGVRQQDGQAADGGDGSAPHTRVWVTEVFKKDVHHKKTDVRLLSRCLDNQVTYSSLIIEC